MNDRTQKILLATKEQARQNNQKWFFTGKPCQNGHIDKRYLNTGICYSCKRTHNRKDYIAHKDRALSCQKKSYSRNKGKRLKSTRKWAQANSNKVQEYKDKYKKRNIHKVREAARIAARKKRKESPEYRVHRNISKQVWAFMKDVKAGRSWENIVGVSFDAIKQKLESQFTDKMNWNNYGTCWEIDHIRPISSFPKNTHPKEIWNLNNLQPLEVKMNRSKQNKNQKLASEIRIDMKYDYLTESSKTEMSDYEGVRHRIKEGGDKLGKLLHASLGLSSEAGEISDQLKKHLYYGSILDEVNLVEELGDLMFYVAMVCRALDVSLEEVLDKNIKKLKARYGDKFTEHAALNRDLDKEREILEK